MLRALADLNGMTWVVAIAVYYVTCWAIILWALMRNDDDLHDTAMGAMGVGVFYSIALLVLSFLADVACQTVFSVCLP